MATASPMVWTWRPGRSCWHCCPQMAALAFRWMFNWRLASTSPSISRPWARHRSPSPLFGELPGELVEVGVGAERGEGADVGAVVPLELGEGDDVRVLTEIREPAQIPSAQELLCDRAVLKGCLPASKLF